MDVKGRLSELAAGRELMQKAGQTREELVHRADEIRAQFAERVTQERVTGFMGWTLVSTGMAWGMTDWLKGRRNLMSLMMPMAMMAMGMAVLGGGKAIRHRAETIGEAEGVVRDQLASLGPLARARVLRDMAAESAPLIRRIAQRN